MLQPFFYWTFSNVWLIIDKKLIKLILKILQQQCQKVRKSDEIKAVELSELFEWWMQHLFSQLPNFSGESNRTNVLSGFVFLSVVPSFFVSLLINIHFNYKANGFVLKYNWVYFGLGLGLNDSRLRTSWVNDLWHGLFWGSILIWAQ